MTRRSDRPGQRALRAVHELAQAAQGAADERDLLDRVCRCVAETLGFHRVSISRYRSDEREIAPVASYGVGLDELDDLPRELGAWPFLARALAQQRVVFVDDVRRDPAMPDDVAAAFGARSILAVPLLAEGRCLGFLAADRAGERFTLDEDEVSVLETIGVMGATFLEKAAVHDELRRLDQLKSTFIALASHELRNPASVIFGIASTLHLRGDKLRPDQLAELRKGLYEQSDRMRRLVDQLLDLSRLEAGSIKIEPQRLPVRQRVEQVVLLTMPDRASQVQLDVDPRLEAVVDENALDRIVSNLLANAFRYGTEPIRVAAEQRDRHFRLRVEDRGPGVAPEFVPRLFERFARGDPERKRTDGAGLGLSIAKSYAHAHGGDLLYEPAKPHGACFELVLPREPGPSGHDFARRPG